MKRTLLVIGTLLLGLWSVSVFAERVGVVDMQAIFQSSPQIKRINEVLKDQFTPRRESIVKLSKSLRSEVQQFQKNQSVMSAKNLEALRTKISTQGIELRQAQQKFQKDLAAEQSKKMQTFIATVRVVVKKVAMKKKLDLVLPGNGVLYSSKQLDITSEVMAGLKK